MSDVTWTGVAQLPSIKISVERSVDVIGVNKGPQRDTFMSRRRLKRSQSLSPVLSRLPSISPRVPLHLFLTQRPHLFDRAVLISDIPRCGLYVHSVYRSAAREHSEL